MTAPTAPPVRHDHRGRRAQDAPVVPLPRASAADGPPGAAGVLYGSFACPWSYLASQRTDLIADPARRPAWRMVDPVAAPGSRLAAPAGRPDPQAAERAAAQLDAARSLLLPGESLPGRPPGLVPHVGPAVVAYAEAVGAGVGDEVRRLLFDAYWRQGLDIGLPDVLRRLLHAPLTAGASPVRCIQQHGYAVTLTGGPLTTEAHLRARGWHQALPAGALPALADAGRADHGSAALAALAERLGP